MKRDEERKGGESEKRREGGEGGRVNGNLVTSASILLRIDSTCIYETGNG